MRSTVRYCRYACCGRMCYTTSVVIVIILFVTMVTWYDVSVKMLKAWIPGVTTSPKKVLLLAYMHTGSTFLGSVFNNHPGIYYEFEPLRSLEASYLRQSPLTFLDGTSRKLDSPEDYTRAGADTAWKLLSCQHEKLDLYTLSTHYFNLSDSQHNGDRDYYQCLLDREKVAMTTLYGLDKTAAENIVKERTKERPAETMNVTKDEIKFCLQNSNLLSNCKNATVVMNKYIRMTMKMAQRILRERIETEDIKIIHLYRDPRAILDSQVRRNNLNVTHFPNFVKRAESMCSVMLEDYVLARTLKEQYPDIIYTLRYETMLEQPIETIRKVFNFLDLEFLSTDEDFILKEGEDSSRFPKWREHISQKHLEVVDKFCSKLYPLFQYIPMATVHEVRNERNQDHLPE